MDPKLASQALLAACPQLVGERWVPVWHGSQTTLECQARVLRLDVDPASGRCALALLRWLSWMPARKTGVSHSLKRSS